MKCFRALLSTEQKVPRRWIYTIFADLVAHLTSSDTSLSRAALAILVELVEKHTHQEGIPYASNPANYHSIRFDGRLASSNCLEERAYLGRY